MIGNQQTAAMVVKKLEGVVERSTRRYVLDKELSTPENKRYKMVDGVEKIPAGFLVLFPLKGHSIRVDEDELNRLKSRLADPNGYVEAEAQPDVDMSAILRASGGGSLVTVIQEGAK